MVRDAVPCPYPEGETPRGLRLRLVREEVGAP